MFDPKNLQSLDVLNGSDLLQLPEIEDEFYEYKSSRTEGKALREELWKAASGFWNSGGGLLVVGVNDSGRVDGGYPIRQGDQSRRDWMDTAITRKSPAGPYRIHQIGEPVEGMNIEPGKAVFLVGFGPSELAPHMGPDNKYFIRAGAHTEPASHFIVESLWARRHLAKPRLLHLLVMEPYSAMGPMGVLKIVTATPAPALNVEVTVDPWPSTGRGDMPRQPFKASLVDQANPYVLKFTPGSLVEDYKLTLKYDDLAGNRYEHTQLLNMMECPMIQPNQDSLRDISRSLSEIARNMIVRRP